jgi:response regulator of citrate/malate metabolism
LSLGPMWYTIASSKNIIFVSLPSKAEKIKIRLRATKNTYILKPINDLRSEFGLYFINK